MYKEQFIDTVFKLILSSLNLPLLSGYFRPLQALVVDEEDLKWVANEKVYCYY